MEGRPGTPGQAEGRPGTPGQAEGRPETPGQAEGRPETPRGCPAEAEDPHTGGASREELLHMSCLLLRDGGEAGPTPGAVVENGGGFGPGNGIGISPTPGTLLRPEISPTPWIPVEDGPEICVGISPTPGSLVEDGPEICVGISPTPGSLVEDGPGPGFGVRPGISLTPRTLVEDAACCPPTSPGLGRRDRCPSGPAQWDSHPDGAPGQLGRVDVLGPAPGPRRRGRGLRNSFTILEQSQASGRVETRALPVITWDRGPTPGAGGTQHNPTGRAEPDQAQEDPTRRAEDGQGAQDPTLGETGNEEQEDPTEAALRVGTQEDPTCRTEPGPETQEDPTLRDETGWEEQEEPTESGPEEWEGCAESGCEAQGDPTKANTGQEAQEDPAKVQPHQEAQEDHTESGPEEQEDPSSGDESGLGRPVSRRLTYIIKSRGSAGWEGASQGEEWSGGLQGEAQARVEEGPGGPRGEAQARSRPGPPRLTSFAEQRQLKERRPGGGPQAGLRRSPGSRPGPEWAQVRQGLELKQEEIRARLQAREARLGRRWQSLGRRAYCRLLKLAGREGEAQATPGPWEGSLAAAQAQLQALNLQAGHTSGLGPSDGWAKPGLGRGQGAELGRGTRDWAQGEAARPGHSRAQQDPDAGASKLLESGRQEGKELEVSPAERSEPLPLDWGSNPRPLTCRQEAVLRQRRESRREPLEPGWRPRPRIRLDRDGERLPPGSALPPAEPTGLKLFKEPSTKSNRLIVHNALTYCCLAGKVNEAQRGHVLRELVRCEHVQCLILFRDRHCQFRALYSLSAATGDIQRLWGTGPKAITMDMIDGLYKYNSDRKQFHLIPSKIMSPNVDALTIHGHLWSARKRAALGSERR